MKAAMFYGPGDVKLIEIKEPKLKEDEVLIKVKACGICGTDDLIFKGKYPPASFPLILGHEYSGEVVEIGNKVTEFKSGDKVAVDPNILCGKCFYCKRGEGNLCKHYNALGVTLNGGFAEFSAVPVSNVYKIAENVDCSEAAMIEPLSCCIRGFELGNVSLGDIIVVLGSGTIGNFMIQLSKISGAAKVIVVEPLENKRKLALESGADYVLNLEQDNVEMEIKKIAEEGADVVFECSGNKSAQESTLKLTRRGGNIIFFGCSPEDQINNISPYIINENELTIRGSFNNPYTTSKAVRLISSSKIKSRYLISHRLPLSDIGEGFNIFGNSGVNKIIIKTIEVDDNKNF